MKKQMTIALQFLTAIIFAIVAVLNLLAHRWLLGVIFVVVAALYTFLGVFYVKHYKG